MLYYLCRRSALVGLFAVLCAGCGLNDYESKIVEEQQRVERFDKENKELGAPIDLPERKEKEKDKEKESWPVEIFLRLPKGLSPKPQENLYNGAFHYQRDGKGDFASAYVLMTPKAGQAEEEALRAFGAPQNGSAGSLEVMPFKGPPVQLRSHVFDIGTWRYHLYVDPTKQVAIVYLTETTSTAKGAITEAIKTSLQTLALGGDALRAKGEYHKRAGRGGRH